MCSSFCKYISKEVHMFLRHCVLVYSIPCMCKCKLGSSASYIAPLCAPVPVDVKQEKSGRGAHFALVQVPRSK